MDNLLEARLEICRKCPLFKVGTFGAVCDSSKYMNSNGDISYMPKEGYIRGCNCILKRKAANPNNHCICGKW